MIKAFWAAHKKSGMSAPDFYRHWYDVHGCTHGRKTAMRRYIQHHSLPEASEYGRTPTHDGVSVGWFDDIAQMKEAFHAPEWGAMSTDSPNLFDQERGMDVLYAVERPVIDGETTPGMVKLIAMARRSPELTIEEFQREWYEVHGELASQVPGQRRYVQNHPPVDVYQDPELGGRMQWDACAEHWYDDLKAMRESVRSPEMARLGEHAKQLFAQDSPLVIVVATETPIIP